MFSRGYGHLERRGGSHCHEYAHAYVGCCQALGYMARPLLMWQDFYPYFGHCFPEVWSNELDKWVLIDPTSNVYYLRDDGMPMNTREIREAQYDSLLFKRISTVRADKDFAPALTQGRRAQPDISEAPRGYDAFSIWLRNNYMDEPAPYSIWDGVHTFRWDERLWYEDPRLPPTHEFTYHTNRWDDMYWGVNETFIRPEYRENGVVRVELSHTMPYFRRYEVRFNKEAVWIEYTGDFLWKLQPGENNIEVRAVSQYDIRGIVSTLKIMNNL